MTQVNGAQRTNRKVASTQRARVRSVAAHRADLEGQVRSWLTNNAAMALTEPEHVRARMKELRKRAGNPSQYDVAHDLSVPPRTFQSWENAEVETDRANYEKVARYYSRKLKEKVSANWILFGTDDAPALPTPDLMEVVNGNDRDTVVLLRDEVAALTAKVDRLLTAFGLADDNADLDALGDRVLAAFAHALEQVSGEGAGEHATG